MKEITKAKFINTWASEWDERTGWKVSEEYHKQFSEQLEYLINQEVEKRIAERMPSDEEQDKWADRVAGNTTSDHSKAVVYKAALSLGATWLRSRLTNPGVNDSQKTEGGGE